MIIQPRVILSVRISYNYFFNIIYRYKIWCFNK
nr:MAG TPA: hypothetical protein [Caudoviricetes sp.]